VHAGIADTLSRTKRFDEFRLYHRKDGRVRKEGDELMSATFVLRGWAARWIAWRRS
jgi:hypothetical protein